MNESNREIIQDGPHTTEVLNVLRNDIRSPESLEYIRDRAATIMRCSVDPISGPPEHPSDGLLYGLIQSGKTSVITVAAGMAADNGFRCIVILTSDIDLLYDQTLERIKRALRGLTVLGKNDWRDASRFQRLLRSPNFVIVCSKNGKKLHSLLEAFRTAKAKGLPTFIIDDEADQASLNTLTSTGGDEVSKINEEITNFRNYFPVNTYLQVTATPQALFLQRPDHKYRPSFTVLTESGPGYVGGEHFFGDDRNNLLRFVPLEEVDELRVTLHPEATGDIPQGLSQALCTFLVAATCRVILNPSGGYAFLCHVSVNKRDHEHIVRLIDAFKENTVQIFRDRATRSYDQLKNRLRNAYLDLSGTEENLPTFEEILDKLAFYLPGANVKLINATSNEEISIDSVYNIFVGGTKLGRGVTIKNLLVSYYGRNPQKPKSDTVLQHARMYGYRMSDIGLTRLFLPEKLADHFILIHQMESSLRELVSKYPDGNFEGLYISSSLDATRKNVLDPNSIGLYVADRSYNPRYPLRNIEAQKDADWLDSQLTEFTGDGEAVEVTVDYIISLISHCKPDSSQGAELWDLKTMPIALETLKHRMGNRAYLVVRRDRNLMQPREETRGILSGGEEAMARRDAPALFMYRQNAVRARNEIAIWWPQLRFPEGSYVMAFSFNR